jgi:glycosyltransferase involved in cell wall biosynthesis
VRLAWLSPLPPTPSGIADYSFELLPLLAADAEVDAVSPRPGGWRRLRVPPGVRHRTPEAFARRLATYGAVFHHLGNNPHHEFVYEAALAHPGVAVFHELVLHHMLDHMLLGVSRRPARYEHVLEEEYGAQGLRLAELRLNWVATDLEKFLFPLAGHVARRARAIVVHNHDAGLRMEEVAPGIPVTVIPHHAGAPPREVATLTRASARRGLGIPEDAFVVGHFGYITRPKHPGAVIGGFARVASANPRARMVMVGADHSGGGVQKLVERHAVAERVRLAGFTGMTMFYAYLRAVDVVVNLRYPSAGESSGTMARALAEGKPLVVNNVGSFGELPDDVACKVEVDEDQAEGVARELTRLADDEGLRARMSSRAAEYARTVLDPVRCRDLYLEVARTVGA